MRTTEPLEKLLGRMQRAGLDVSVDSLMDAFWLALQPGLRLDSSYPVQVKTGPDVSADLSTDRRTTSAPELTGGGTSEAGSQRILDNPSIDESSQLKSNSGVFAVGAVEDDKSTRPASPLRIPAGAALARKLPLTRSLRPLRKWFSSSQAQELNEEGTAEATAQAGGRMMPVLHPRLERWYELIVVADSAPSMDVWFETILEFEEVARTAGVFRDIRHYQLGWRSDGVRTQDESSSKDSALLLNSDGVALRAVSLAQTNVRRLILIATNGSAAYWTDGRMAALLGVWSKQCSVAMLQMLPEHMWHQVRTGEPKLLLRNLSPGVATALLDASALWWEEDLEDPEGNLQKRVSGAIPILPLDPLWIDKWARMQMGGGQLVPGIVVGNRADEPTDPVRDRTTPEEWRRAVNAFTRNCTPEAWSLATYLSRSSFTLPVARLVQATKLGKMASQSQLAEILLSGLVQRITAAEVLVPREWIEYRFHPEAANILVRGLRESDADEIADALAKYIEHYWGKPVDFRAMVYDPNGLSAIPQWARPFAQLGQALLKGPGDPSLSAKRGSDLAELSPSVSADDACY